MSPNTLNIAHPENFYGGTSMIDVNDDTSADTFDASNYFELADSPSECDRVTTALIIA